MPGAVGWRASRTNHGPTRLAAADRAAVVSSVPQAAHGRPTPALNAPQNGHKHWIVTADGLTAGLAVAGVVNESASARRVVMAVPQSVGCP